MIESHDITRRSDAAGGRLFEILGPTAPARRHASGRDPARTAADESWPSATRESGRPCSPHQPAARRAKEIGPATSEVIGPHRLS